ncbi:MAG: hypothetical protein HY319_25840 [Armatimonadetes bacterium]|nr:hypothetical protein [Armatimonadota bacterium]
MLWVQRQDGPTSQPGDPFNPAWTEATLFLAGGFEVSEGGLEVLRREGRRRAAELHSLFKKLSSAMTPAERKKSGDLAAHFSKAVESQISLMEKLIAPRAKYVFLGASAVPKRAELFPDAIRPPSGTINERCPVGNGLYVRYWPDGQLQELALVMGERREWWLTLQPEKACGHFSQGSLGQSYYPGGYLEDFGHYAEGGPYPTRRSFKEWVQAAIAAIDKRARLRL